MTKKEKKRPTDDVKFGARVLGYLIKASRNGDLTFVKRMLREGVPPDILVESCGSTPLTAAVRGGHIRIVRLLLDSGVDPNLQDTWVSMPPNGTALESAAAKGHVEIAKLLVERGADVNKVGHFSPVRAAAASGQPETLRFLLKKKAHLDSPSIIMLAVRKGNAEVVQQLIEVGVDVNFQGKAGDGDTPLHVAAWKESSVVAEMLIAAGAKLNAQTLCCKDTPLHIAASQGRMAVVQALLRGGADFTLKNFKRKTPEEWAKAYGEKDVQKFLREYREIKTGK